jgi:nucleoside-diphosphate-sugar epimerase
LAKVFITGGAGYCGSVLVPFLIQAGHEVTVYDTFWFGAKTLNQDRNLKIVIGDIRDVSKLKKELPGHEIIIHLACISNDSSFELDEALSTSINLESFEPFVILAKNSGINKFIYASSSSVYGISDKDDVTEDHPLVPLTLYNKFKGQCEPILLEKTSSDFVGIVFRPATVCGYSPRQRLDVSVNIMTNLAINKRKISVFGGLQQRPNLHIQDYAAVVKTLIDAPESKVQGQIFNVGNENLTIDQIALKAKKIVELEFVNSDEIRISHEKSNDARSYHINSDKIFNVLGFRATKTVDEAILELCKAFKLGLLPNSLTDPKYFNVKQLKMSKIT